MGLIKIVLKLILWGTAALTALCGVILALQKLELLPKDVTYGMGPVSLRVRSGGEDAGDGKIDDDLI